MDALTLKTTGCECVTMRYEQASFKPLLKFGQTAGAYREEQRCSNMDRLPVEVMGHIFHQLDTAKEPLVLVPLLFTSRLWNRIAMEDPRLWADIIFGGKRSVDAELATMKIFLQRSKQASINISIFHSPHPDHYGSSALNARPFSFPILSQLGTILRDHYARVRSFTYVGLGSDLFPFPVPMPKLVDVVITVFSPNRGMLSHLLKPGSAIRSLRASIPVQEPLRNFDPLALKKVAIYCSEWNKPSTFAFLGSCQNLTSLCIDMTSCGSEIEAVGVKLALPSLASLELIAPGHIMGMRFSELPGLVHLSVVEGRKLRTQGTVRFSCRFGGCISPETAWPSMPNLRTLTLDHVHVADVIPTLSRSPLLVALHLHGNLGFRQVLKYLNPLSPSSEEEFSPSSSPSPMSSDVESLSSFPSPPLPIPHLQRLRLWPVYEEEELEFGEVDDFVHTVELFDNILHARRDLTIEIGATHPSDSVSSEGSENSENDDGSDSNLWEGQWDSYDLETVMGWTEYSQRIEIVDGSKPDFPPSKGSPPLPDMFG